MSEPILPTTRGASWRERLLARKVPIATIGIP